MTKDEKYISSILTVVLFLLCVLSNNPELYIALVVLKWQLDRINEK